MKQPAKPRGLHASKYLVEEVGQYRIAYEADGEIHAKFVHFIGNHKQYEKWYNQGFFSKSMFGADPDLKPFKRDEDDFHNLQNYFGQKYKNNSATNLFCQRYSGLRKKREDLQDKLEPLGIADVYRWNAFVRETAPGKYEIVLFDTGLAKGLRFHVG